MKTILEGASALLIVNPNQKEMREYPMSNKLATPLIDLNHPAEAQRHLDRLG